jgi:AraC family transcriptional regulator
MATGSHLSTFHHRYTRVPMAGIITVVEMNARLDFRSFVVRQCVYSPGLRQRRHSHEYNNVTVITGGQLDESSERGEYRCRPSSVVLKAAGCEHETRISGYGARTLTIEFGSAFPIAPQTWLWSEDIGIVRSALALQLAFCSRRVDDVERLAVDLIASAIERNHDDDVRIPKWVLEIKATLDASFQEPICFEALARDIGLHPVYVSRAFRRHVGRSMTDYVRALRLREARHLLAASRWNIGAIAGQAGFSDSSHLCRTFSDLLQMTPKTYRRLCRGEV